MASGEVQVPEGGPTHQGCAYGKCKYTSTLIQFYDIQHCVTMLLTSKPSDLKAVEVACVEVGAAAVELDILTSTPSRKQGVPEKTRTSSFSPP